MSNDDTPRLDRARLERLLGKESADLHAAWESQLTNPDQTHVVRNIHLAVLTFSMATVSFVVGFVRGDNWMLTLGWLIAAIVMGRIAWTLNADGDSRDEHGVAALLEDA